jgi:hypothetical protein
MSIPKVIAQTSSNKILSDNWEHKHFTTEQILDFFKEHENVEFPNILEKYIVTPELFKYYYLYIYGGFYIDNAIVLHTSIESVAKTYGFVSVLSINENSIFAGIIGCSAKNPIIYKILKMIYDTPEVVVGAEIYKIIHDDTNKYDFSIKLYKELTNESRYFANTYDVDISGNIKTDEKLFTHYFKSKMVPIKYVKPESIRETKIAITFCFPDKLMDVFTNGIRQNTLFFYELLSNIGYDVHMVVQDRAYESTQKLGFWNNGSIKYLKLSELSSFGFHIVIQFGFQLDEYILDFLKACDIRTVFYNCGNKYFLEGEACLYNKNADIQDFQYNNFKYHQFNQLWLIPQMMHTCLHYMQILYRSNAIEVPFVWSPSMSELYEKELGRSIKYKPRGVNKSVSIFEPNLSIIKWAIPSILICENAHRTITDKSLIKHVYVTNMNPTTSTNDLPNVGIVNKMVKSLDIFVNKKLSIEGRYNSLYFMSQYADIAVSHQMENPLNYLYLDLAWMGWPIIHNAHLCKDVGYYYEGFDYGEGSEILKRVILTHDDNAEEYIKRNRAVIHKYLPTNKYLQEQYISLINNLL